MSFANKATINYIEYTYDSSLSSYRNEEVEQPNGSYKSQRVQKLHDSSCGVYVHRAEEFDNRRTVQPLTGDFRIYTFRDSDIKKGDILEVTSYGTTYKMIAGDPMKYETHQEVVCHEEGVAD